MNLKHVKLRLLSERSTAIKTKEMVIRKAYVRHLQRNILSFIFDSQYPSISKLNNIVTLATRLAHLVCKI